jgi:hypothetical protein
MPLTRVMETGTTALGAQEVVWVCFSCHINLITRLLVAPGFFVIFLEKIGHITLITNKQEISRRHDSFFDFTILLLLVFIYVFHWHLLCSRT